ncbi:hypothetical protein Taro_046301 [Colocasia esculenta]|uniref:Uncharacterized protein n=1 Tax=Colocasia esculenta TaxID=4460 RepID=A0A843X5E7_COLES|nr:hypothetical protein [Colocasia esculenta]
MNQFYMFLSSFNVWETRRAGLGFLQGLWPENLASRSLVAKILSQEVRARRTSLVRRPVPGRAVAVQGQYLQRSSSSCVVLQQCSFVVVYFFCCTLGYAPGLCTSLQFLMEYGYAPARSREADSDQVRYRFNGLGRGDPSQLVSKQEISEMADRRDWGGGGDDPEESTQRMIERIWESLTDIQTRMDQQAPVPPVAVPPGDGEVVPVTPAPPRVEVPFVAPVPPPVNVTSRAFRIHADRVYCGCGGRCEASVSRLYGMHGVDAWFEQVKSRVGPEIKQDLLLSCWNWRPGMAVDLLASRLVDVDSLNLATMDVDAEGGVGRR